MLYDFLKVSDDMMDARSRSLARLLTARGRKTSPGDALLLMLRLDRYVVQQARDTAPDLRAELAAASFIPEHALTHTLVIACEWPERHVPELMEALQDRSVGVLQAETGGWRVLGVAERYASFAEKRRDSRGRAAASRLAKEHGWVAADGGGWTKPGTTQRAAGWRELLALLEAQP